MYNEDQSKIELIEELILKYWSNYCLKNWLSDNHEQPYSPEIKVKRLLDRCGTLLLRDVPPDERDTLTSYKEMIVGSREINVSDCPEAIAEMLESGCVQLNRLTPDDRLRYELLTDKLDEHMVAQKKKKARARPTTRYERLEAIRRSFPGCSLNGCQVDTDGCFEHNGAVYQVDSTEGKYAPHKTRYGDQFDMDRIIVIEVPDGGVHFADQDGYLMDDAMIAVLTR